MQKTDTTTTAQSAHRQVRSSTTLSRRYVKRPVYSDNVAVNIRRSPKVQHFNSKMPSTNTKMTTGTIANATPHPIQVTANERVRMRSNAMAASSNTTSGVTAKQLKDQAIQKALASASQATDKDTKENKKSSKVGKMHFGFGRVVLALSCAAIAVVAIAYFVNLNMPDISLRVAAMQTGIEASYPSYVPRNYILTDISSENGKVTLNFRNNEEDKQFSLVEEKSSWDSNALLTNFVKPNYSEGYSTIREQGLTIYVDQSNAAWVNGGIFYKITAGNDVLTKKQIKSIATSV